MTNDLVCGKRIDEKTAQARTNYQGREYHFCSADCKRQFDEHPERYAPQQQSHGGTQQQRGGGAA